MSDGGFCHYCQKVNCICAKSEYLLGFEACREQVCGYLATRIKSFRTKTIGEDVIDKVRALRPGEMDVTPMS